MIVEQKGNFILQKPLSSWDMNYHLWDKENKIDYLISIDDVADDLNELEENEDLLITWEALRTLEDIEAIKEISWKQKQY